MDVTRLSEIYTHHRCPKCGRLSVTREAFGRGKGIDGHTLWDLRERCIIEDCGWSQTSRSVKVGL